MAAWNFHYFFDVHIHVNYVNFMWSRHFLLNNLSNITVLYNWIILFSLIVFFCHENFRKYFDMKVSIYFDLISIIVPLILYNLFLLYIHLEVLIYFSTDYWWFAREISKYQRAPWNQIWRRGIPTDIIIIIHKFDRVSWRYNKIWFIALKAEVCLFYMSLFIA